jgi:type IV pilus assembly protein PilB
MNTSKNKKMKIGELLLAQGIIDEDQLEHALSEHKRTGIQIGKILVRLGMVDQDSLNNLLGEQIQLKTKKKLGDILIERKLITQEQLEKALARQKATDQKLGKIFIELGFVKEEELIQILSAQMEITSVNLEGLKLDPEALAILSDDMCREYKVIPLYVRDGVLTVGMTEPTNLRTLDHIKFKSQMPVEPVLVRESELKNTLAKAYAKGPGEQESLDQLLGADYSEVNDLETVDRDAPQDEEEELSDEEGKQVVKIVSSIVNEAIGRKASDIHLEPQENFLRLRYRIDGILMQLAPIPGRLMGQILSRIKILSKMDIAEKRRPQDGRFTVKYAGKEVDLRVNSFPTILRKRGVVEKIVMRILDPNEGQLDLRDMGFQPEVFSLIQSQIKLPNGIILVTGPTGSGKSTTLYSFIREIYTPEINITTMEDPVELNIEGINQGQINKEAGFTFAAGIRAILRQDPDVIMIGEMRDKETAGMAIESALTGHLVFSTLHTNNAAGSFPRLLEMGLEPFLVSSAIKGVMAQRLVRRICKNCKEEDEISKEVRDSLGLAKDAKFYKGKGCKICDGTGYKGRAGLYEFLVPNDRIQELVIQHATAGEIKKEAMKQGLVTLRQDGIDKALKGITTLEAIMAASENDDE